MLLKNEKLIDLSAVNSSDKFVKYFNEVCNELKNTYANEAGVVTFKFVDSLKSKEKDGNGREKILFPRAIPIEATASIYFSNGVRDKVRYCETFIEQGDGKPAIYTPNRLHLQTRLNVNMNTDADKAFFLYACSPHCENGLNKNDKVRQYFIIENRKGEAKAIIDKDRTVIRAKFLILSDPEEGGLNPEVLRSIACAYNMRRYDSEPIDIVRQFLLNYVDKFKKHEKFIMDTNFDDTLIAQKLANQGIHAEYFKLKAASGGGKKWVEVLDEFKEADVVSYMRPPEDHLHYLVKAIRNNTNLKRRINDRLAQLEEDKRLIEFSQNQPPQNTSVNPDEGFEGGLFEQDPPAPFIPNNNQGSAMSQEELIAMQKQAEEAAKRIEESKTRQFGRSATPRNKKPLTGEKKKTRGKAKEKTPPKAK